MKSYTKIFIDKTNEINSSQGIAFKKADLISIDIID